MTQNQTSKTNSDGLWADIHLKQPDGFSLHVKLDLPPRRTAALLGPNGAGKSTTVRALAGLTNIDRGRIELNGRLLNDPERHVAVPPEGRRVGLMFQNYALFEHMTVEDNIAFGPRSRGLKTEAARLAAAEWTHAFDLASLASRKASDLSGGQAQRVAMARTMAANPEMILLDEPLAALDIETRATVRRALAKNLSMFDGPRLLITHEPAEAFLLADDIYVIEDGQITQTGTAADIRQRPATPYVAALAGSNFLTGMVHRGAISVDNSDLKLRTSDTSQRGAVIVTIHPNAVALHPAQPVGSPRNTWPAVVESIEVLGDVARVYLGAPLPLAADVTPGAVSQLNLSAGSPIWVAIKATEVTVAPA